MAKLRSERQPTNKKRANCVRCEPVYKLLETFEPVLELIRGDSPY